jgi:hypothetical protein
MGKGYPAALLSLTAQKQHLERAVRSLLRSFAPVFVTMHNRGKAVQPNT